MSTPEFEAFLARIYVDRPARERFLADPAGEADRAGLTADQCAALANIDRAGLILAARSFAHKRAGKRGRWWHAFWRTGSRHRPQQ